MLPYGNGNAHHTHRRGGFHICPRAHTVRPYN